MKDKALVILLVLVGVFLYWRSTTKGAKSLGNLFGQSTTPQDPSFSIGSVTASPGYAFDWFGRNTWDGLPFSVRGGWQGWSDDGVPQAPKPSTGGFGVGGSGGYGSDLLNGDPFANLK